MQEQYGEYLIRYNEIQCKFEAYLEGVMESYSQNLSDLKKRLDKSNEEKKTFPKVPVFKINHNDESASIEKGTITSIAEDGRAWVSWEKKGREKLWSSDKPILLNQENLDLFEKYNDLLKQEVAISNAREEIFDSMEKYYINKNKE